MRNGWLVVFLASYGAGRTAAAATPGGSRSSFRLGGCGGGRCCRRGLGRSPVGPGAPAASPGGGRRSRLIGGTHPARRHAALDLGPDLALGAEGAVRGVDVHPPDHDRRWRAADWRPFLGQGPARVDGVPGVDLARELPVQPFPCGDRWHGHVNRTQPDRHREHERGWRWAPAVSGGLDRERRQVAGDAGEDCYLGFGDRAAARRPLAAKRKIVERKRLQIGPSIEPSPSSPR